MEDLDEREGLNKNLLTDCCGIELDEMVMDKHPRYDELKEVHNACMIPLGDGSGTQSLAQDTINVTIHSMAAASCTVARGGRLREPLRDVFVDCFGRWPLEPLTA